MVEDKNQPGSFGVELLDRVLKEKGIMIMYTPIVLGELGPREVSVVRKTKGLKTLRVGAPFTSETNDSFTQALCIYDPQQTQVRILDINAFRERPRYEDVQKVAQLKTEGWKAEAVVDKIVVYKPREKQSNPKTAEPAA